MANPLHDQLIDIETHHIMLRGLIDALILIDDHVGPQIVHHRDTVNALHTLLSLTLRNTEKKMDQLFSPLERRVA